LDEEQKRARKRPFSFLAVELLSLGFLPDVLMHSENECRSYNLVGSQTDHKCQL